MKIEEIVNFVCFDIEIPDDGKPATGTVTIDEMKYLFQLGYQFLNRVSDLDLSGKQYYRAEHDENAICGSKAEIDFVGSVFGKEGQVDRGQVVQKLKRHVDVQKFLAIFNDGKVGLDEEFADETMNNSAKMDSMNDDLGSMVEGGTVKSYPEES
jgi:hypothetical protein